QACPKSPRSCGCDVARASWRTNMNAIRIPELLIGAAVLTACSERSITTASSATVLASAGVIADRPDWVRGPLQSQSEKKGGTMWGVTTWVLGSVACVFGGSVGARGHALPV